MKAHGLPHTKSCYEHRADKVVENEDVKVLWDFNIQVDKFIEARRSDIMLVRKKKSVSSLILLSRVKYKEEISEGAAKLYNNTTYVFILSLCFAVLWHSLVRLDRTISLVHPTHATLC